MLLGENNVRETMREINFYNTCSFVSQFPAMLKDDIESSTALWINHDGKFFQKVDGESIRSHHSMLDRSFCILWEESMPAAAA